MADVSVVITVKDDPRVITCIEGVLGQIASFPFDVVVVDNGSRGELPRILRDRFGSDPRVKLLSSGGNLSEAWNLAARSTDAPVLVRIDADAAPLPGWLEALVRPIRDGVADWTAGPVGGANVGASVVARYYHERTEAYNRRLQRDLDLRDAVPSWNVAYRRSALEAAGWYDPWQASSVDWDLHKRLARSGSRGQFVPGARAVHHHPTTFREFVRKEAWYRTGQYQMALKYGLREMVGGFSLPFAYALVLVFALASLAWPPFAWLAVALFLILLAKHWIEGIRESDPLWYYRGLFRPIEGAAGLYGIVRGFLRYGVRAPRRS
jgi:glycosyltransferase involved in cell wall biosynthesis